MSESVFSASFYCPQDFPGSFCRDLDTTSVTSTKAYACLVSYQTVAGYRTVLVILFELIHSEWALHTTKSLSYFLLWITHRTSSGGQDLCFVHFSLSSHLRLYLALSRWVDETCLFPSRTVCLFSGKLFSPVPACSPMPGARKNRLITPLETPSFPIS